MKFKKSNILLPIILLFVAFFFGEEAFSQRPVVKMKLDSVSILMGKITHLDVEVSQQKGTKGRFTLFSEPLQNGVIPVCGDSVEFRIPNKVDTVDEGRMELIKLKIPVQAFDSGYYRLPELVYVAGADTARSNKVSLKVYPPAKITAETPIDDYAGISDPENSSIFDSIPDWLYNWWWLLLVIIALGGAIWYLWRKYKKDGHILPKKLQPTPYEIAVSALKSLKEKKLWEQGMEKDYYTDLTDILRAYLAGRFGINAKEMTSRQILGALSRNAETKDKRSYFRQILDMADFVKFAKVRPLPADNIASMDNAMKFVEETKPVVVDVENNPEAEAEPTAKSNSLKKGKKEKGGKK